MTPEITILIPVWNNENEIYNAYRRVREFVLTLERNIEILFIDDGSMDATFAILQEIQHSDQQVSILKLSRNYGQHPAVAAGIHHAMGEILITMDIDLQCDPSNIPRFLSMIEDGYDLVSGWRIKRKAPLLTRRLPSLIMNLLVGAVTGLRIHDYGCGMNALTRKLGSQFEFYGDQQRFLKPLAVSLAKRIGEVKIVENSGLQKESRYNMKKLVLLMVDFIISFSTRRFRLAGLIGLFLFFAGGLGGCVFMTGVILFDMPLLEQYLFNNLSFILIGILIVIIVFMGEYIARKYHLLQGIPLYIIEQHLPSSVFYNNSN